MITNFPSLWEYLQSILAYQSPPFVAAFLIGIFWAGANRKAAFWGLVGGHLLSAALFMANMVFGVVDIHFLYVAPILFVFSMLLMVVLSIVTSSKQERSEIEEYLWTVRYYREETRELARKPWYQNYRIQSVIILTITAVIVLWFW